MINGELKGKPFRLKTIDLDVKVVPVSMIL